VEGLAARAAALGDRIREGLRHGLSDHPQLVEIRGKGLMVGVEMRDPCGQLVGQALEAGLLINVTAGRVIRLLPPLILSDAEADELVSRLLPLIQNIAPAAQPSRASSA